MVATKYRALVVVIAIIFGKSKNWSMITMVHNDYILVLFGTGRFSLTLALVNRSYGSLLTTINHLSHLGEPTVVSSSDPLWLVGNSGESKIVSCEWWLKDPSTIGRMGQKKWFGDRSHVSGRWFSRNGKRWNEPRHTTGEGYAWFLVSIYPWFKHEFTTIQSRLKHELH